MMAILGMLPQVILGPFIGALVDRWNRQRVMVLADSAIAVVTLVMAVLFFAGKMQIPFLYVTAAIRRVLGVWDGFKRRIVTSMIFLTVMGAAVIVVGSAPAAMIWLAVAANAFVGLANTLVNGPLFAFLQSRIAPEMQGRVFALVNSLAVAISPLGMALAAPIADNLEIQVWWQVGGAVCIVMGAAAMLIPSVININEPRYGPKSALDASRLPADWKATGSQKRAKPVFDYLFLF